MLQLRTILMRLFGYPYNNDLVICKDSPDYLTFINISHDLHNYRFHSCMERTYFQSINHPNDIPRSACELDKQAIHYSNNLIMIISLYGTFVSQCA